MAMRQSVANQSLQDWKERIHDDLEAIAAAWPKLAEPIAAIEQALKEADIGDKIVVEKSLKDALARLTKLYKGCPVIRTMPGSPCFAPVAGPPRRRAQAKR
jgi:hypothetical protein